jgi:hypothetical protein
VNGQHLRAFLWLRWRLLLNQLKRGGVANAVILAILLVLGLISAAVLAVVFFVVGLLVLPQAHPVVLLYVWDGLVVAFLFSWIIGLANDLQRAESLALDKFLHLPVSLAGAFLINYLSSLFSVNLILFVPAMLGLVLGLVLGRGPVMLLLLPLLAAFLLTVTALTYQFQGWLAALMVNKRRRRNVLVLVTAVIILLAQAPNLVNLFWLQKGPGETQTPEQARQAAEQWNRTAWLVNVCLPPGWLPLGAQGAAEGDVLPALLGTLGLTLIGTASLWRAYRTTVRLYTGHFTSGKKGPAAPPAPVKPGQRRAGMLEKELPWVPEQAAAVALAGFRSLLRAPEAKMMLLTPAILAVILGGISLRGAASVPELVRPLLAFGALALILVSSVQLGGNQFGMDRDGFRVFVLCPAGRRDILLGKNLAAAPPLLVLCLVAVALVEWLAPMRLDHLLALLPQVVSMYLLFCLVTNWLSILAPMRIAAGSLRPANSDGVTVVLHLVFVVLLLLVLATTLLPLGLEGWLRALGWAEEIPVCLVLSVAEVVAVVYLYRGLLTAQGRYLQAREQKILAVVTSKTSRF